MAQTVRARFDAQQSSDAADAGAQQQPANQSGAGGEGGVDRLVPDQEVLLDGNPLTPTFETLLYQVEVHQSISLVDMAILYFDNPGGALSDAPELSGGVEVEVKLGYLGSLTSLFKGLIISSEPVFPVNGSPYIAVRAYDRMHTMRRGRKQRTFLEQKLSDIVSTIAGEEGLSPDIEDTEVTIPYVLQSNQSNVDFLKELSRRYLTEIRVDQTKLILKKPQSTQGPGKTLHWHSSRDASLKSFYVRMSAANLPTKVETKTWDMKTKAVITGTCAAPPATLNTASTLVADARRVFGEATKTIVIKPATDAQEADALAASAMNEAAMDSVRGRGTAEGDVELVPGLVLELAGLGASWSGQYYVTGALHVWTRSSGYSTQFDCKRPGIGSQPASSSGQQAEPGERREVVAEVVSFSSGVDTSGKGIPRGARPAGAPAEEPAPPATKTIRFKIEDEDGEPLTSKPFSLKIGEETFEGTTDDRGYVNAVVPADAQQGELTFWLEEDKSGESHTWPLRIAES